MTDKTIFEKIAEREEPATFLYEDEHYMIIESIDLVAPVHCLAMPKKAVPGISQLTEDQLHIPGDLIKVAKSFLQKEGVENFKLTFNGGKYLHIPDHLHLHILGGDNLKDS
mgnify:CR=1 FL=1